MVRIKLAMIYGMDSGKYLSFYDPEAHAGRGEVRWTDDPTKAMVFKDREEAFLTWKAQPKCKPFRVDGQPNRPLTYYTIELETV